MRGAVVALISLLCATPVFGQGSSIYGKDCHSPNGGTIKGMVKDSSGKTVGPIRVKLDDIECEMGVASNGFFMVEHVPPGIHRIRARNVWYMTEPTIEVSVLAGKITQVDVTVQPTNGALECTQVPECARILEPDAKALAGLSEEERMREVGLRTAFALTHSSAPFRVDGVSCIEDPAAAVRRAVIARLPLAVPATECGMSGPMDKSLKVHLIETRTGRSARQFYVRVSRVIDSETFEGDASYYAAPLNGATWECRYKKVKGAWIPKACIMTVIS